MFVRHLIATVVALGLPAAASAEVRTVTLGQVTGAATAAELLALGAHKVGAAEFAAAVVGHAMDEGGWTWIVNADGSHASAAKDGSWTDEGGTWHLDGDRYCRESPGNPLACSDVYLIGGYLRVADPADGTLADWTVRVAG